ncbi:monovalent cation/H+ antiporter subunit D [Lysobacteraceae bacterium NML08-0793]|nr:monovalent cation/H+ antiporter subunit D [Xanthomonadaceae bacterium NML08-0793]
MQTLLQSLSQHLLIAPILIPVLTGALLLLLERKHEVRILRIVAWLGMTLLAIASVALLRRALHGDIDIYLLADWPAQIGIVLVLDRLAALMVMTTTLLAIPVLLYACAGWDRRALHFHTLLQIQLAGLNGAFLTGDLFNLFVFFEVLLIASYGLLLSGARGPRLRAGMHYVVFNIAASTLFLIALAVLYAVLGTLNMAEMAARIALATPTQATLLRTGGGLLLLVFCAKAALLPLYMWLPDSYSRAPAAVAALFAIMTKVGLYAVLRTGTLMFGSNAGELSGFARQWLLVAGLVTIVLAALGVLGAARLRAAIAYLVLLSAGTLFVAFSLGSADTLAAGLYYLPHSTFAAAALFLLTDLILRVRGDTGELLRQVAPIANKTVLSVLFLLGAIAISGLPPLSGFIGKLALLMATPEYVIAPVWTVILASSLLSIIGIARMGTQLFWRVEPYPENQSPPPLHRQETFAVVLLLGYVFAMTLAAQPLLDFAEAIATQILHPADYLQALRETLPQLREPMP